MELWLANPLGKGQIQFSKSSIFVNSEIGSGYFPKTLPFFGECNSVRIGQNIQSKVLLDLSLRHCCLSIY